MQYKSQRIAKNFYTFAVLLFLVQIVVGIIQHFSLSGRISLSLTLIPSGHCILIALVVWLLAGMMGGNILRNTRRIRD